MLIKIVTLMIIEKKKRNIFILGSINQEAAAQEMEVPVMIVQTMIHPANNIINRNGNTGPIPTSGCRTSINPITRYSP